MKIKDMVKVPLILTSQPEGGFTITSPLLPELITEGDTLKKALDNVQDAILTVIELYKDLGREFPSNLEQDSSTAPIYFEHLVQTI